MKNQTLNEVDKHLPVLAKIYFGTIVRPYLLAGPYFATKIGIKYEATVDGATNTSTNGDGIADNDLGLIFGAGIQTPLRLSIEARYSMGLRSIYSGEATAGLDIKNSNIQLLVGCSIF